MRQSSTALRVVSRQSYNPKTKCAHAAGDPAEVGGFKRCRIRQREERDPCGATFPETRKKLRWAATVGARLLRGYGGGNEEVIRKYIQEQEAEDRRLDQLEFPTDSESTE